MAFLLIFGNKRKILSLTNPIEEGYEI